mmetsp:Transcript_24661/g.79376  ORF Transcript_24661/g.79376 Transcript_24661/m.79376 type:complete len:141 (+) Transcript_24661:2576-2998(+)
MLASGGPTRGTGGAHGLPLSAEATARQPRQPQQQQESPAGTGQRWRGAAPSDGSGRGVLVRTASAYELTLQHAKELTTRVAATLPWFRAVPAHYQHHSLDATATVLCQWMSVNQGVEPSTERIVRAIRACVETLELIERK